MARRAKRSRSKKPTIWQALNEPVVEIPEEIAKSIFLVSFVILAMAWLSPYFGSTPVRQFAANPPRPIAHAMVAGAYVESISVLDDGQTPEWYLTINSMTNGVQSSFVLAANEVLDISEPVGRTAEFYEPGVQAVWDAWLELMADPY